MVTDRHQIKGLRAFSHQKIWIFGCLERIKENIKENIKETKENKLFFYVFFF
jgi:hypothetical protein